MRCCFLFGRDGKVSMNEYIAFMISRETENVHSAKEVVDAFQAITEGGAKPYVTEEELYQASGLFKMLLFFLSCLLSLFQSLAPHMVF